MEELDLRLDSRVIVVTGAAAGIGLCIARYCLAQGAIVYLTDRDAATLERSTAELGDNARAVTMDVSNGAEVANAIARIQAAHDGIDVLVNNAGVVAQGGFADTTEADWQRLVAVQPGEHFPLRAGCRAAHASAQSRRDRQSRIGLGNARRRLDRQCLVWRDQGGGRRNDDGPRA